MEKTNTFNSVTFSDFVVVGFTSDGNAIYQEVEHSNYWNPGFRESGCEFEPDSEAYRHDLFCPNDHLQFEPWM